MSASNSRKTRGRRSTASAGSALTVSIGDLWVGDRFFAHGSLWTYLGNDGRDNLTARRHDAASIKMGSDGYGYIGDTICSFERSEMVKFQAPNVRVSEPAGGEEHQ